MCLCHPNVSLCHSLYHHVTLQEVHNLLQPLRVHGPPHKGVTVPLDQEEGHSPQQTWMGQRDRGTLVPGMSTCPQTETHTATTHEHTETDTPRIYRRGPLTTKQNRVKQKKHALYTWHTHTVPPIQWSGVHHTLVCHCSVLTGLSSAHMRTHSPSCTEQGQAGLSCCSSVSYSQGTHTSHP